MVTIATSVASKITISYQFVKKTVQKVKQLEATKHICTTLLV